MGLRSGRAQLIYMSSNPSATPPRRALLLGATGLVGRALLARLLEDAGTARIDALVRRPLPVRNPRLRVRVVDFAAIATLADFPRCDDVFCCLGTTIRSAGSQAAMRGVDVDLVVDCARAARGRGASRLALVSAMGADPTSRVFYNRVKGQMEQAIAKLGFDSTTILRPSLLDGERDDFRPGERFALALARPLGPLIPAKYRAIPAGAVASAMLHFVRQGTPGVRVVESDRLQAFAVP